MKKIVILILAIFLVTGCKVKYDVVINEDLSVKEEAKLTCTDDTFSVYYKTTRVNVLKSFIDMYKDFLDEKEYQYELKEEDNPYVLVTKKYDNPSDFVNNSILFNDYFDEVKYTEKDNIKKIETVGFHENESENQDRFDIKELEITINSPYQVVSHNAKKVDKRTNTFYYELNEKNNKILFEYDANTKFNPNSDVIGTLIICLLMIVAIWIVIIYLNKKNKK